MDAELHPDVGRSVAFAAWTACHDDRRGGRAPHSWQGRLVRLLRLRQDSCAQRLLPPDGMRADAALLCAALLGCASTKVETSGSAMREPLCQAGAEKLAALVYWGPRWRPDQKEPALREAAAERGIEQFFAGLPCVALMDIRRMPLGDIPSDAELLRLAGGAPPPDRVVAIVVRELGPVLKIGLPVLVEGGTEVVLEVRILDVRNAASMANVRTHWQNGGTFVVKGVKTLEQDMSAALAAVLMPAAADR